MEIGTGLAIAGIWIAIGIYSAYLKKDSDIFWIPVIMTILILV